MRPGRNAALRQTVNKKITLTNLQIMGKGENRLEYDYHIGWKNLQELICESDFWVDILSNLYENYAKGSVGESNYA